MRLMGGGGAGAPRVLTCGASAGGHARPLGLGPLRRARGGIGEWWSPGGCALLKDLNPGSAL